MNNLESKTPIASKAIPPQGQKCVNTRPVGEDEIYAEWHQCGGCGCEDILDCHRYCPNCGSKITVASKTEDGQSLGEKEVVSDHAQAVLQNALKAAIKLLTRIAYDETVSSVQSAPGRNPRGLAQIFLENEAIVAAMKGKS